VKAKKNTGTTGRTQTPSITHIPNSEFPFRAPIPFPPISPSNLAHCLFNSRTIKNNLLLLINILGPLARGTRVNLLIRNIPAIQVPNSGTEIRREAQPSEVWDESPASDRINSVREARKSAFETPEGEFWGEGRGKEGLTVPIYKSDTPS
jgi:hypothetical protein